MPANSSPLTTPATVSGPVLPDPPRTVSASALGWTLTRVLALGLALTAPSGEAHATVAYNATVAAMVNGVTQAELKPAVDDLSGETTAMIGGAPYTFNTNRFSNGHVPGSWTAPIDKAEQYLYEKLIGYGYKSVSYQIFPGDGNPMNAPEGRNVIAQITGTTKPNEIVVIGCHIDTMNDLTWPTGRSPGADDNASGCSALLYLARSFVGHTFTRTIRFAFFDAEENAPWDPGIGNLFGSGYYAYNAKANNENIVAMIQADGLAYNAKESSARVLEMHVRKAAYDVGGGDAAIYNLWRDVITTYSLTSFTPRKMEKCGSSTTCGSYWSDNGSFWKWGGYNAVLMVEEEWVYYNPNWHTAGDLVSTFDWTLYTQATKSLVALAAHQAGIIQ